MLTGLYQEHCASCHGVGRLGGQGPALLPENLGRLGRKAAQEVIADGRIATQMPGFADSLSVEQITALTELVYTPLSSLPEWTMADIEASRIFDPGTVAAFPTIRLLRRSAEPVRRRGKRRPSRHRP